ncbi:M20 family peptidase [bacterium]|nr:M20 family peptidase [bacterium]
MGIIISAGILVFVLVLCFRAARINPIQVLTNQNKTSVKLDVERTIARLSEAVKKPTISYLDLSRIDRAVFQEFITFLVDSYPFVHQNMKRELVNDFSSIYHWKGTDPKLKPVLLLSHIDVVPVEKSTEADWTHPAFSGEVADGFVWGRGTMDMKLHLISIMETAETLLKDGFTPRRDIYFAFGHDEETRGEQGAMAMAKIFVQRGIEFEFVLDEGGVVAEGAFPAIKKPLAMVGIAEKGIASIELTVNGTGGHSSMPPRHTAVGLMSRLITDLENNQMKARVCDPVKKQFERIGTELPFLFRLVTANLWLFGPIIKRFVASNIMLNSMVRTTTAATMMEGSKAHNVLPPKAKAVVNFRLLPGDTMEDLTAHIKKISTLDDLRIDPVIADNPSKVSPTENEAFAMLEETIHQSFPGVLVVPYLVMGATDSRQYENSCGSIYRFSPIQIENSDRDRIHNVNERISLENVERSIRFFHNLMLKL